MVGAIDLTDPFNRKKPIRLASIRNRKEVKFSAQKDGLVTTSETNSEGTSRHQGEDEEGEEKHDGEREGAGEKGEIKQGEGKGGGEMEEHDVEAELLSPAKSTAIQARLPPLKASNNFNPKPPLAPITSLVGLGGLGSPSLDVKPAAKKLLNPLRPVMRANKNRKASMEMGEERGEKGETKREEGGDEEGFVEMLNEKENKKGGGGQRVVCSIDEKGVWGKIRMAEEQGKQGENNMEPGEKTTTAKLPSINAMKLNGRGGGGEEDMLVLGEASMGDLDTSLTMSYFPESPYHYPHTSVMQLQESPVPMVLMNGVRRGGRLGN